MKLNELFTDDIKNIVGYVVESELYKITLIDSINNNIGFWMLADKSNEDIKEVLKNKVHIDYIM